VRHSPADPDVPKDRVDEAGGRQALGRTAVGGAAWEGASFIVGKVLTLATTVILARILTPNDFGLVALALVFISYAEVITDLGVGQALIYLPADRRTTNQALIMSFIWSGTLCIVAILSAPAIATYFERPAVAPMMRILGTSLVIGGIGGIPDALLRKALRFPRRVMAVLARALIKGVVSVVLAVMGLGPWALVWGYIAGEVIWSVVAWSLAGYRPGREGWRLSRDVAGRLLSYGLPAAGSALLLALVFNIDYLIVGERLGSEALGFYTIAYRIPELVVLQALWVVSAVTFPLFSLVRGEPERVRRGYLTSMGLYGVYGAGLGIGIAVMAPMLVPVLFGPRWTASIAPLQALALYAVFGAVGKSALDLFKGLGRPRLAVSLSFVRLVLVVPALLLATNWGIEGVSWAQAATSFVMAALYQAMALRLLELPASRLFRALVPGTAVAAGTLVGAGAVRVLVPGPDLLRLTAALVAAGALGLGCLWLVDRRFIREVWQLVRRRPAPRTAGT
jgi:lipopolysaccharide exporter